MNSRGPTRTHLNSLGHLNLLDLAWSATNLTNKNKNTRSLGASGRRHSGGSSRSELDIYIYIYMSVEIYSEHHERVKLLSSAGILRGSSADLPRIHRGAGKMNLAQNSTLMSAQLMSFHDPSAHEFS